MIRRETYLPLDTLKTKPVNEQLRQVGGSAKLIVDVIKYDPACIKVNKRKHCIFLYTTFYFYFLLDQVSTFNVALA